MNIDRTNYEIWLIDWLDGKLSDLQANCLMLFLKNNPDLKDEFDELNACNLKPANISFSKKDLLKKSETDLSAKQFEYLCVAYLENDLSPEQLSELQDIIDKNYEKKRVFELVLKTKLIPPGITYIDKNQLLKRSVSQKIIRLSIQGLSAAAVIALIIMTYLTIPKNSSKDITNIAADLTIDSVNFKRSVNKTPKKITEVIIPEATIPKTDKLFVTKQKNIVYKPLSDTPILVSNDSATRKSDNQLIEIKKAAVIPSVNLKGTIHSKTLIAFNSSLSIPETDDRSNVSKFIAKTFREKILKEETSLNKPVKGYEIAEAGVTGLNKLFGWEMALDKRNDEFGELRSVCFSSKIVKFNAPVNKN